MEQAIIYGGVRSWITDTVLPNCYEGGPRYHFAIIENETDQIVENDIAQTALINAQEENANSTSVPERLGFELERTYKSDKSANIWNRYTLPFAKLMERGISL